MLYRLCMQSSSMLPHISDTSLSTMMVRLASLR